MDRRIFFLIIICLWLISGMDAISYAGIKGDKQAGVQKNTQELTGKELQEMKKHMQEMQRKNPAKYAAMMQKTGGKITHCSSCHTTAWFKGQNR